jgi:acyl dehydratase
VPVGSMVRAEVTLAEANEVTGGVQLVLRATMQIKGEEKPGCVADWVTRVYF